MSFVINPYRFGATTFELASRSFTSGDYIDMGDVLDTDVWVGTTSFSIAMWVKPSSLATDQDVFSKLSTVGDNRQFTFRVFTTGDIGAFVYNTGTSTGGYRTARSTATTVTAAAWHHVVLKVDQSFSSQAAQLDIFDFSIDGTQTNSTTWLAANVLAFNGMDDTTSPVQLSGFEDASVVPFVGNMSDVRVYDKILSNAEVSNLYAGTEVADGLVGRWITDVDDGATTLPDYSTNSNDGTNNGTTYSADSPL